MNRKKKTNRTKFKDEILEKTEGVLETATDIALAMIFSGLEFGRRPTITASDRGSEWLEIVNYQVLKKAINNLITGKMVTREGSSYRLTDKGREKLSQVLVIKNEQLKRNEGEVYLITYDILEESSRARDRLRQFLKRNKMAKVQASVYICPFDPREILNNFIEKQKILGQILVTKLGRDSVIGDTDISQFLRKIYNLDYLEGQYAGFVETFSKDKNKVGMLFVFNNIYKNDPCLSSEFLPKDWVGEKARRLYENLLNELGGH